MSPDGESIVTGAGDETLRFWNVFSKARSQKVSNQLSYLNYWNSLSHVFEKSRESNVFTILKRSN